MTAATYNLTVDQGSDFSLSLKIKEDGAVKALTGYSARAHIRSRKTSNTLTASFTCTITSLQLGEVTLFLSNATSKGIPAGVYYYDLELYTSSDALVVRLLEGTVTVRQEVTR